MDLNFYLLPASIAIELIIFAFGIVLAIQKKKIFGWFIALTFGIYSLYDLFRFLDAGISSNLLSVIFFIATISILCAVWLIYREN
jgi:hypothetical protein